MMIEQAPEAVHLRSGHLVWVRPVLSSDAGELQRNFALLSELSRYRRFLTGTPHLTQQQADYFSDVDHYHHEALLALSTASATDIVGVARFIRYRAAPTDAELAITVADDWQGRGLATVLLRMLRVRAREVGVQRFTVEMLADNPAVLALVRSAGLIGEVSSDQVISGCIELGTTAASKPD